MTAHVGREGELEQRAGEGEIGDRAVKELATRVRELLGELRPVLEELADDPAE